jgi:dipeptidyl aminopeptidase/acylaminoacyl peptidase
MKINVIAFVAGMASAVVMSALLMPIQASAEAAITVPPQIPVRAFFKTPEQSSFRLSPDGKFLSYMKPWSEKTTKKGAAAVEITRKNIFIQAIDASGKPVGEAKRITSETARDIAGYSWKGSRHFLFEKDFGGDENFHVVSAAIDGSGGGNVRDLTPFEGVRAEMIDDLLDDADHILVSHNQRDKKVFDVYKINLKTGASNLVAKNPGNITNWVTDHAGKVRGAATSDGVNTSLLYRATEQDEFKTVVTTNFRESVDPLFFTFDNKRMYVNSNVGRDKKAIVEFDLATAKEGKVLFEHPDVDAAGLGFSRERKVLTEVNYVTAKPERKVLDDRRAALYKALEAKLPGYEITLQSHTKDENRWIVAASNDRTEGARYLFDAKTGALSKLAVINSAIIESQMAFMKPVTYKSRDGLTINGYLTLPAGREAKNLPVVINPHGGPWARDVWGYNPEVQLLANRGYAVLQMNFRGSTGYGRKFWEASFRQWGRAMQDDITDGVQWLIKDYVGVSNMFTFMKTIPPYWEPLREMFYEMVGNPEKDEAYLRAVSPVFLVDKIKTPLFVAQGARDPRVNKAESDQIVEALKKRGVAVEYMLKENEGHGFRNQENQFEFYEAMDKFLATHLKK